MKIDNNNKTGSTNPVTNVNSPESSKLASSIVESARKKLEKILAEESRDDTKVFAAKLTSTDEMPTNSPVVLADTEKDTNSITSRAAELSRVETNTKTAQRDEITGERTQAAIPLTQLETRLQRQDKRESRLTDRLEQSLPVQASQSAPLMTKPIVNERFTLKDRHSSSESLTESKNSLPNSLKQANANTGLLANVKVTSAADKRVEADDAQKIQSQLLGQLTLQKSGISDLLISPNGLYQTMINHKGLSSEMQLMTQEVLRAINIAEVAGERKAIVKFAKTALAGSELEIRFDGQHLKLNLLAQTEVAMRQSGELLADLRSVLSEKFPQYLVETNSGRSEEKSNYRHEDSNRDKREHHAEDEFDNEGSES